MSHTKSCAIGYTGKGRKMDTELKNKILHLFREAMKDKPPVYWAGMKIAIEVIKNM